MKRLLLLLVIVIISITVKGTNPPDEGMWLPILMDMMNYSDMQKMGLKLTKEQIYSINKSSIKDAVVGLGNSESPTSFFCSSGIVSTQGLMFTNHHCVYEMLQSHSTVENDILSNGFWALNKSEELPNEGFTASILLRMEDVTERVLASVTKEMTEQERKNKTREVITKIEKEAGLDGKYAANVKSVFEGNGYYLMVYEVYKDVRLVGAPPSSIGKFGGDSDNWMWPRQTGDFGILRIYTGPDGKPATYSKNNIPLKPKYAFPISLKGEENNDFTLVCGFPGSTDRYLTSWGVKQAIEITNPASIKIRDKKLAILREDMNSSDAIRIKYVSKYATSANYWKYFKGQTEVLKNLNVYENKKKLESEFNNWLNQKSERREKYGDPLKLIEEGYTEMGKYSLSTTFLNEAAFQGPEIIYFCVGAMQLQSALEKDPKAKNDNNNIQSLAQGFKKTIDEYFKNYNLDTDKKLFVALMKMYYTDVPKDQLPDIFNEINDNYKGDFQKFANEVYKTSIFVDKVKLIGFLDDPNFKTIDKDLGYKTFNSILKKYFEMSGTINKINEKINQGNRLFIAGIREMQPDKDFYPDANSTLRYSYGKIIGIENPK